MTKSSSSDQHSDSPCGVISSNRKHRSDRRPLRFWQPFNDWWRNELERTGRRPTSDDIQTWWKKHSTEVWQDAAPTLNETRVHAKCLRSLPLVRDYFREYRAKKKTVQQGKPAESQCTSVGHASETEQQSPSSRSQISPNILQQPPLPAQSCPISPINLLEIPQALNPAHTLQQSLATSPTQRLQQVLAAFQVGAATAPLNPAVAAVTAAALSTPTVYQQLALLAQLSQLSPDLNRDVSLQSMLALQSEALRQHQLQMVAHALQLQNPNPVSQAAAAAAAAAVTAQAVNPLFALQSSIAQSAQNFTSASQPPVDLPSFPLRPTPRPFDRLELAQIHSSIAEPPSTDKLPAGHPASAPLSADRLESSQSTQERMLRLCEELFKQEQQLKKIRETVCSLPPNLRSYIEGSATAGLV